MTIFGVTVSVYDGMTKLSGGKFGVIFSATGAFRNFDNLLVRSISHELPPFYQSPTLFYRVRQAMNFLLRDNL
jgi:hypothetical protein